MEPTETRPKRKPATRRKSLTLAFLFGVAFLCVILIIALFVPHPSSFQYTVFRIVLALAAAGVAAEIPGILKVKISKYITGSGALGIFLVVYFYSPAKLFVQDDTGPMARTVVSIKEDTTHLKAIVSEFVQRSMAAGASGQRADDPATERAVLTELEKKYNLPSGVLTNKFPAFAKKLKEDGTASSYERALGTFAAKEYGESERLALLAAAEAKKALPLEKSNIIKALELAGWSASKRRDDTNALTHFTAAASFADKSRDPLAWARVNFALAYVLHDRGDGPQAEGLLREVLAIRSDKLGHEHPNTLATRNNLAGALFAQGKSAEAEAEHRAVLKIQERVLGLGTIWPLRFMPKASLRRRK